ncbi:MAG: hypothetical protein U1E91_03320 [Moraxella sp.]
MYAEETTTNNQIKDIIAHEILDSRGNPTIEADVILADGYYRTCSRAIGCIDRLT